MTVRHIDKATLVRLDVAPGRLERGERIATFSLAPLEEIAVAQLSAPTPELPAILPVSISHSAADSVRHARDLTRRAARRLRRAHQVTIAASTGAEPSRTVRNLSDSIPVRVDYYLLRRIWRIRLYRYGVLLGEWTEHTPAPGTDIVVTRDLDAIA